MTRINQRDDAYYDAYDEDIVAGRVKPVRTTHRTNPGARNYQIGRASCRERV